MIIWQGFGFVVPLSVFGFSLIANLISNAIVGEGYYDHHKWPVALSFIPSALLCWFLGNYLSNRSDQLVIDKKTGKEFVVSRSRHTLFFIPMRWWSPILLVSALILVATEFLR